MRKGGEIVIGAAADRVAQEQWAAYRTWRERWFPTSQAVEAEFADALAVLEPSVPWESVMERAAQLTRNAFRSQDPSAEYWRMTMYAPIYVANYCSNTCRYCGFRAPEKIVRRHLTPEEAMLESDILFKHGFRHQLLLTGEDPLRATTEYLCGIIRQIVAKGRNPSVEIPPQSVEDYHALAEAGTTGVTLYQETYDETLYADYHPHGPKSHYRWRFGSQERGLLGGLQRVGFGFLVGLAEPRSEFLEMLVQAKYLQERFPERTYSFGLPRIREAPEGFDIPYRVGDDLFRRMYAALRIAQPSAELVISVREPAEMRNLLSRTCLTQISAGSHTNPGGYADEENPSKLPQHASEQCPTTDNRTPREVADWLHANHFEVISAMK